MDREAWWATVHGVRVRHNWVTKHREKGRMIHYFCVLQLIVEIIGGYNSTFCSIILLLLLLFFGCTRSLLYGLVCLGACGNLVLSLGIESASPALQGRYLTTGPPVKSLHYCILNNLNVTLSVVLRLKLLCIDWPLNGDGVHDHRHLTVWPRRSLM